MKKEDEKLQGLCKECTHRNSCETAKRHIEVIGCGRYRHWKKKQANSTEGIGEI